MKIAFHLATPPAPLPQLDAAMQEIESLRSAFGGDLRELYPGAVYRPWIRRHRLRPEQIESWLDLDKQVDLHHVVSDRPIDYPVLRLLRRPVIYRLLTPTDDSASLIRLAAFGPLVVSAASEAERLHRQWGLRVEVIAPGIDTDLFATVAKPPRGPFTLMFASAPWTRRHFVSKGLDALFDALSRRPEMGLVLLGRGVLKSQIERRIRRTGLDGRTEFIDEVVRPEDILARTHATVLAPTSNRVVKAYPHSLLEALAAGRPVVTSRHLAISELVREQGCGEVVEPGAESLGRGLDRLAARYGDYRQAVALLDMSRISIRRCISDYRRLYRRTLEQAP